MITKGTVEKGQSLDGHENDRRREQKRASENRSNRASQDIGPPPDGPEDKALREACDASLRIHLETCYPAAFSLEWSLDHLRLIDKIDKAATNGGLSALAMPRGAGKTTIMIRAALWALLTGRRRFCVIVASTETAAKKLLKGIKTEILYNEQLASLYPQELHALRNLEGEAKRASGQRCEGDLTGVEWLTDRIGFGCIPGVQTSGSVLSTCGITGNIRGQQSVSNNGEVMRPDLVLIDDPQTKESARSKGQCEDRHSIMVGDILGMAGPNTKISGFCTCTVIYRDDLADQLLDRTKSPEWQGEKCQMVYKWPDSPVRWDEYRTVWEADLRGDGDGTKCREFVEKHFEEMHAGSRVGWEARKNETELSALQHAYHLRFRDEPTFFAEYQNSPVSAASEIPFEIRAEDVAKRIGDTKRNVVPDECEKITAFVDVQKNLLFYCVMAWTPDARGHVIDYGAYPEQGRSYFHKRDIRKTLQEVAGAEGLNEAIYAGLEGLTGNLFGRTYRRGDGAEMRLDRMGVDARWGFSTRVVRRFCRETTHAGRIHPMMGQYIGKDSRPWHRWTHTKGDKLGVHCRLQAPPKNTQGVRELLVDTNWWKSFAAERLVTNIGSDKSIVLFHAQPHIHRMFAEHCAAEEPRLEEGKSGNRVIEWKQSHGGLDNDYWDCLIGNCVLASLEGVKVHVEKQQKPKKKNTRSRKGSAPLAC